MGDLPAVTDIVMKKVARLIKEICIYTKVTPREFISINEDVLFTHEEGIKIEEMIEVI